MARLDTGWHAHPKILQLGLAAMGLHAWSISYCDATRSDGFIPTGAWPALPGVGAACKTLVVAGMWERCDGGFQLHDYLDYNRSRAQISELGAAMRANGQAGGQASAAAKRRPKPSANAEANAQAKSTPGPGPVDDPKGQVHRDSVSNGFGSSTLPPTPSPNPDDGRPIEASPLGAVVAPTRDVAAAIEKLYGPPVRPERLPNGAQQCPLCPDIFTGSYSDHLDSPRHKIRPVPDDLSGFRG
jgi:hypothetical protein